MIKFDTTTLYNKQLDILQQDPDWKVIANNSVISALLKSQAEALSETARYAEYLFKESRWDAAQNTSSILAMSNMLGYQPKRKVSAAGQIYVSLDPRTHLVGTSGLAADTFKAMSNDPEIIKNNNWNVPKNDYIINKNCTITDSAGNSYVATASEFKNNSAYAVVNIMQGKRKSAFVDITTIKNVATTSKIDPYLYIPVTITDCENASSALSKAYFRVYVVKSSGSGENITTLQEEYRVVDSLLLSSYSDYDVEVYNDLYSQNLFYLKFNNDPSRGNTLDISNNTSIIGVQIDYLESLGKESNITSCFERFTLSNVQMASATSSTTKLYGINLTPITGGADEETISEIKVNAPRFYMNNYTAGTRESYENTILNTTLKTSFGLELKPTKVKVYRGEEVLENKTTQSVTCVTFLADSLENLLSNYSRSEIVEEVSDLLKYSLSKIKSPQDVLRFVPPTYVAFAVGAKCTVSRTESGSGINDPAELETKIRNLIDTNWGDSSNYLDFGRDFYPSYDVDHLIHSNFSAIEHIDYEIEAIKKLDWSKAERIDPSAGQGEESGSTIIHTCRIPFDFNSVFVGSKGEVKGFKSFDAASYVMRIDFMYKKPSVFTSTNQYHTTLFVEENRTDRNKQAEPFYVVKEISNTSEGSIWPSNYLTKESGNYTELSDAYNLENTYQYRYKDKVYNNDEFTALKSNKTITTISDHNVDWGCVDNYLIYFSANYNTSMSSSSSNTTSTIGNGWIEISFDAIHAMLSTFSLYDANLRAKMQTAKLSLLKCGNTAQSTDPFTAFIEAASDYVDIYVSMRPVDSKLIIKDDTNEAGAAVLYIDSSDGNSSEDNVKNLTIDKRPRMISVECDYSPIS